MRKKIMDAISSYHSKHQQFLPLISKGNGKFTTYIEGYPVEEESVPGGGCHGEQISSIFTQLKGHFVNLPVYVGSESFVYYQEGDIRKKLAPDIYVIFGVEPAQRSSFYTWREKAVPRVVIEFLSEGTEDNDRYNKREIYFEGIGITEYLIHQPDGEKSDEFLGWRRTDDGTIEELQKDSRDGLFSAELNLGFMFEMLPNKVRLLRPYLPDGTPLPTYDEYRQADEENKQTIAKLQTMAEEALARTQEAEERMHEEVEKRARLEAELDRLRAQLTSRSDE